MLNPDDGYDCDECNAARTVINVDHNLWRCKHCYAMFTDNDIEDMIPTLTDEVPDDEQPYRCVNGHDRCGQMSPGPTCPYCERVTYAEPFDTVPAGDRRRVPHHGPGSRVPDSVFRVWLDRASDGYPRLARLRRVLRSLSDFRGWFER